MEKNKLRDHASVKAYWQHGFLPTHENSSQIFGTCPFCGGEQKFYVNKESKKWDCKTCGKRGGFKTFLKEIYEHCQDFFSGTIGRNLAKDRKISLVTLKKFGFAYNFRNEKYMLPIIDINGEIQDIRTYSLPKGKKKSRLYTTTGCLPYLFGMRYFDVDEKEIWLCEGEWDGMALYHVMQELDMNDNIVSVPGSETMKQDWIELFRDKNVHVLYDNDKAGKTGMLKAYGLLLNIVESIDFIHWPDTFLEGYDIRDLCNEAENASEVFDEIRSLLSSEPEGLTEEIKEKLCVKKDTKFDGEGLTHEEIYKRYTKWLHLPDTDVVDILFGALLANRLKGEPIWLFLVAPPGFTKTALLNAFTDALQITCVSKVTPQTLISGFNLAGGVDPSLIPRLDGQVLIIKDFTPMLTMNEQIRDEIFGILRDAFDGETTKAFGNGIWRHYKSKFGIVTGVTPAIELYTDQEAGMGERFLRYRTNLPTSIDEKLLFLQRATGNNQKEDLMSAEMRETASAALNFAFDENVQVPDEIHEAILYLALWVSQLRSTIIRDRYTKEITHKPFTEAGTRVAKQFYKLIIGIAMFKRKKVATWVEYATILRVARSTIPTRIDSILENTYKESEATFSLQQITKDCGLPSYSAQKSVEDLCILGVFTKQHQSSIKYDYKFSKDFKTLTDKSFVYKDGKQW